MFNLLILLTSKATQFVTFCLKKKLSDIEQQVTAVESEMTKVQTEAESLNTEQQQIVAELQERKKTVKDKQVYWRRLLGYVVFAKEINKNSPGVTCSVLHILVFPEQGSFHINVIQQS